MQAWVAERTSEQCGHIGGRAPSVAYYYVLQLTWATDDADTITARHNKTPNVGTWVAERTSQQYRQHSTIARILFLLPAFLPFAPSPPPFPHDPASLHSDSSSTADVDHCWARCFYTSLIGSTRLATVFGWAGGDTRSVNNSTSRATTTTVR